MEIKTTDNNVNAQSRPNSKPALPAVDSAAVAAASGVRILKPSSQKSARSVNNEVSYSERHAAALKVKGGTGGAAGSADEDGNAPPTGRATAGSDATAGGLEGTTPVGGATGRVPPRQKGGVGDASTSSLPLARASSFAASTAATLAGGGEEDDRQEGEGGGEGAWAPPDSRGLGMVGIDEGGLGGLEEYGGEAPDLPGDGGGGDEGEEEEDAGIITLAQGSKARALLLGAGLPPARQHAERRSAAGVVPAGIASTLAAQSGLGLGLGLRGGKAKAGGAGGEGPSTTTTTTAGPVPRIGLDALRAMSGGHAEAPAPLPLRMVGHAQGAAGAGAGVVVVGGGGSGSSPSPPVRTSMPHWAPSYDDLVDGHAEPELQGHGGMGGSRGGRKAAAAAAAGGGGARAARMLHSPVHMGAGSPGGYSDLGSSPAPAHTGSTTTMSAPAGAARGRVGQAGKAAALAGSPRSPGSPSSLLPLDPHTGLVQYSALLSRSHGHAQGQPSSSSSPVLVPKGLGHDPAAAQALALQRLRDKAAAAGRRGEGAGQKGSTRARGNPTAGMAGGGPLPHQAQGRSKSVGASRGGGGSDATASRRHALLSMGAMVTTAGGALAHKGGGSTGAGMGEEEQEEGGGPPPTSEADQLAYSKAPRPVHYTPYTLAEYRSMKGSLTPGAGAGHGGVPGAGGSGHSVGIHNKRGPPVPGYYELGKLGPDLGNEELQAKRALRERAQLYGAQVKALTQLQHHQQQQQQGGRLQAAAQAQAQYYPVSPDQPAGAYPHPHPQGTDGGGEPAQGHYAQGYDYPGYYTGYVDGYSPAAGQGVGQGQAGAGYGEGQGYYAGGAAGAGGGEELQGGYQGEYYVQQQAPLLPPLQGGGKQGQGQAALPAPTPMPSSSSFIVSGPAASAVAAAREKAARAKEYARSVPRPRGGAGAGRGGAAGQKLQQLQGEPVPLGHHDGQEGDHGRAGSSGGTSASALDKLEQEHLRMKAQAEAIRRELHMV